MINTESFSEVLRTMNILILTGKFGMGHYSVAEAIKEDILTSQPDANIFIVDIIEYMFPQASPMIYKWFNFMVGKCSSLYNFLNDTARRFNGVRFKKKVTQKIAKLIEEHDADLVVTTLHLGSQYVSTYKELTGKNIPLYTYITDVTAHEDWIAKKTDLYFVASENTKNTLVSKGVSPHHINVSGIPVKQCFKKRKDLSELNKKTEILIMGGGLGLIPCVNDFLNKLVSQKNLHITMITGTNEKLKNKMQSQYPQIDVIGYTNRVSFYMEKADLLITKSGGVTTFEAIYSNTPLYIIKPFLIQELGNAEYIEQATIGRVVRTKNIDIAQDVLALVRNKALLQKMKHNMMDKQAHFVDFSPIKAFEKRGDVA